MKKIFEAVITAVFLVITGAMLFIFPDSFLKYVCFGVGGFLLALAAIKLLIGLISGSLLFRIFPVAFLGIAGICLIKYHTALLEVIPVIAGICFLLYDLLKLFLAFRIRAVFPKAFLPMFVPAAIGVAIALAIIILNSLIPSLVVKCLGVLLIYNGIDSVFSAVVKKKKDDAQKQDDKRPGVIEADFEEKD